MVKMSSKSVMWSRRLSLGFASALKSLYSAGVMPKVALLISAVRMAKSLCAFTPRFHSALFPFVGQFITHRDAAQTLLDPFLGVAFLLVNLAHPSGGEFGVFDFFEAFVADPGEPEFERLRFRRWDGLDEPEKLLRIRHVGEALLAIGGGHFQTVTIGHGLIPLLFQTLFQLSPIGSGIDASGQNRDDVGDGEIPFFFVLVPSAADLFFFKQDDGAHGWEGSSRVAVVNCSKVIMPAGLGFRRSAFQMGWDIRRDTGLFFARTRKSVHGRPRPGLAWPSRDPCADGLIEASLHP